MGPAAPSSLQAPEVARTQVVLPATAAPPPHGGVHDEDEIRLIVEGRGLFHIHPTSAPVFAIEVEAGDLIRVPRGTHHWFDLCADRRIRAIRLFQDQSGWTPHYTQTGVDKKFQPVCFGPQYFPSARPGPVA